MTTENPSFADNCNEYVDQAECAYLAWLLKQEIAAEEKRNKCKCPSCMSEPGRIGRLISEEISRLAPPVPPPKNSKNLDKKIALSNFRQGRK